MRLSFKYRIYPTKAQIKIIEENFEFCRVLYNCNLEDRINDFKSSKTTGVKSTVNYYSQAGQLKQIRKVHSEKVKNLYSQTLQHVLKRLDLAYENFFRRVKEKKSGEAFGFPRFKTENSFKSICFPQCDLKTGGVKKLNNDKLKIKGLPGEVKVKWHRLHEGQCKQVIIKKHSDKFYIILSCDNVPAKHLTKTGKIIALDLGLNCFAMTDDGTQFHHPKPYKTAKEKLAFLNQKLANKKKGSNNRKKVKKQLAKAHEKVSNVRLDFLHKLSNKLVKENDKIIIEKLNIKSMLEAKGFEVNKGNIADASWGEFIRQLKYKAERAGRLVIEVDPKNTSKMCSNCNHIDKGQTLKNRTYDCKSCGLAIDRDQNAAKNILRLGISRVIP